MNAATEHVQNERDRRFEQLKMLQGCWLGIGARPLDSGALALLNNFVQELVDQDSIPVPNLHPSLEGFALSWDDERGSVIVLLIPWTATASIIVRRCNGDDREIPWLVETSGGRSHFFGRLRGVLKAAPVPRRLLLTAKWWQELGEFGFPPTLIFMLRVLINATQHKLIPPAATPQLVREVQEYVLDGQLDISAPDIRGLFEIGVFVPQQKEGYRHFFVLRQAYIDGTVRRLSELRIDSDASDLPRIAVAD